MLPIAIAIAIAPGAIVTIILLLLGDRGRTRGLTFLLGWTLALLLIAAASYVLVEAAAESDADAADVSTCSN